MTTPSLPAGYDETRYVDANRPDCHITIGFDQQQRHIPRFLVQLHYQVKKFPVQWGEIARMDHNETSITGHDIYKEGLHVDVDRRSGSTIHLEVKHQSLSRSRGTVIRRCAEYLRDEAEYFIDVYEGRRSPGGPPRRSPDGGERPPTLISINVLTGDMRKGSSADTPLSLEELSEVLAAAEGTTAEEIERGAAELEIAPPDEATVVDE